MSRSSAAEKTAENLRLFILAILCTVLTAVVLWVELTAVRSDHIIAVLGGYALLGSHGICAVHMAALGRFAFSDIVRSSRGEPPKYVTVQYLKAVRARNEPSVLTQSIAFLLVFSTPITPAVAYLYNEALDRHGVRESLKAEEEAEASQVPLWDVNPKPRHPWESDNDFEVVRDLVTTGTRFYRPMSTV